MVSSMGLTSQEQCQCAFPLKDPSCRGWGSIAEYLPNMQNSADPQHWKKKKKLPSFQSVLISNLDHQGSLGYHFLCY